MRNTKILIYTLIMLAGIGMLYYFFQTPCDAGTMITTSSIAGQTAESETIFTGAIGVAMCMTGSFEHIILSMGGIILFGMGLIGLIKQVK